MPRIMKIPAGFKKVEESHGVSSYVLQKNGLRVLVYPRRGVPVVGVQITYHVGSRHESAGHTGATHILEHLMFKGSRKFNQKKGNGIWNLLEKKGAQMNATTWCDRTNYYAIVPLALFKDVLSIEADRMRNILLKKEDLDSEMTVVRNEYERGENTPQERLSKQAWYQAFSLHPYRIPTIGTKEDIEGVTVEKLRAFYDRFYHPNNATLSIVGDIDEGDALLAVQKAFGSLKKKKITEPPFSEEPAQEGERRFSLNRKGTVNALLMCFKAPAGLANEAPAVAALQAVLGAGKSSILYRALIDAGLAVDFHADFMRFKDPSLLEVYVALSGGVTHAKTEEAVWNVIERLKKEGPSEEELKRGIAYKNAGAAYAMSSIPGVLSYVNEAIARGDWKDAFSHSASLESVTVKDVQNAARILDRNSVTVGSLFAV